MLDGVAKWEVSEVMHDSSQTNRLDYNDLFVVVVVRRIEAALTIERVIDLSDVLSDLCVSREDSCLRGFHHLACRVPEISRFGPSDVGDTVQQELACEMHRAEAMDEARRPIARIHHMGEAILSNVA